MLANNSRVALARRLVLASVIGFAGVSKVIALNSQAHVAEVPGWLFWSQLDVVKYGVGGVELAVAALLLLPRWLYGAWSSLGLGIVFFLYISALELYGVPVDECGCFGETRMGLATHLGIILAILLLSYSCLQASARQVSRRA